MCKEDFTRYEVRRPKGMDNYLMYNGPHFNKELHDFAVSKMTTKVGNREVPLDPYSKKDVDELLEKYGNRLKNKNG